MESEVFKIIEKERKRQSENVELIASENFVSENVLKAMGSCFTNKYCEGYPAVRYDGLGRAATTAAASMPTRWRSTAAKSGKRYLRPITM